eukprot:15835799-Heterocapsa_arctica.AAC.1
MAQWGCGDMEASRSRRCQPMGQQNRTDAEGRVAQPRELWQGTQGQLRRAYHEKKKTHRVLTLPIRNDRVCDRCYADVNNDRLRHDLPERSRQKGDSQ